jgi:hypothetical protein
LFWDHPTDPIDVTRPPYSRHELNELLLGGILPCPPLAPQLVIPLRGSGSESLAPPPMADNALPQGEIIGIVIGAIVLFTIISVVPM